MRSLLTHLTVFLTLSAGCATAQENPQAAADYPNRPIHIVVPFPAGGPTDVIARLIGKKLTEAWGQPVVIDIRPGANTILGAQQVARAAPDGYTLLLAVDNTLSLNPYLYAKLPYDPFNDFAGITLTTKAVSLFVGGPKSPKSVKDLLTQARANPGKMTYGGGTLSTQLVARVINKAAGVDILYVPFKGTSESVQALLTGTIDISFLSQQAAIPLAQDGKLQLLAKMDSRPIAALPDLPTFADAAGLQNFEDFSIWIGLVAPKKTPKAIIDKLQRKIAEALDDQSIKDMGNRSGLYPVTSTPEEFEAFYRREADRWSKVIAEIGLKYD